MSLTLEEALGQVELEPGRTYRAVVNGRVVDVRVRPMSLPDPPPADAIPEMLNVWLEIPRSPGKTVAAVRRPLSRPDPPADIPGDGEEGGS